MTTENPDHRSLPKRWSNLLIVLEVVLRTRASICRCLTCTWSTETHQVGSN
jgi:hypothetical protein